MQANRRADLGEASHDPDTLRIFGCQDEVSVDAGEQYPAHPPVLLKTRQELCAEQQQASECLSQNKCQKAPHCKYLQQTLQWIASLTARKEVADSVKRVRFSRMRLPLSDSAALNFMQDPLCVASLHFLAVSSVRRLSRRLL